MKEIIKAVEQLINKIPTSELRNDLCDINILLHKHISQEHTLVSVSDMVGKALEAKDINEVQPSTYIDMIGVFTDILNNK